MDNQEDKRKSSNKGLIIGAVSFLLAFLAYLIVISAVAPGKKLDEIREKYSLAGKPGDSADERFYADSAYMAMLKEKSFLQARISMAETDSVYLTLNLPDSSANLEISGVVVHSARISSIKISSILRPGNEFPTDIMFSAPMSIMNDIASIQKEPLMIKIAPKDTSEFKPDIVPDTTDYEPVNYILEMDNGLRLFVYQETDTIADDRRRQFYFDINDRMRNSWRTIKRAVTFRIPEYHPFIKIKLPKADAKIIYRAVPRNGQVAVFR